MNDYEVEWGDGVRTRLTRLDQQATYAGLLEGVPNVELNEHHINWRVNPEGRPQRLLLWAPQTRPEGWPEIFLGSPTAVLPAITCVASFDSISSARPVPDAGYWSSYIEVVWFQEEWALPIIPEVLAKIKSLNWCDVGIDYEP